ncbi:molybdenum ABC transporter ATP-binding protein, partial [Bacillus thuringiensis]
VIDIKVLGELKAGDIIQFTSEATPSNTGTFSKVTDFKLLTKHDFTPLPSNPNAFLGYIMWRHPEEGESSYIANYQNWAL